MEVFFIVVGWSYLEGVMLPYKYLRPRENPESAYIHAKRLEKQCKPVDDGGNNET